MKIKRYTAPDMRRAMQKVREDQGPDAIILSSRRIDGMNEIVAAIDYDEALVREAAGQFPAQSNQAHPPGRSAARTPAAAASASPHPTEAPRRSAAQRGPSQGENDSNSGQVPARAANTARVVDAAASATAQRDHAAPDPAYQRMERELSQLRQMLEGQMSSLAWNDMDRRKPWRAQVLRNLTRFGIEPDIASEIVAAMPEEITPDQARYLPLSKLAQRLLISGKTPDEHSGVVALVGPTGVGKTTTIAKLAARHVQRFGCKQVALICTDDYRVGARDQLRHYGQMLGVPVFIARDADDLGKLLEYASDRRLVLIDTPGMNGRDEGLHAVLDILRNNAGRVCNLLALPANMQAAALEDSIRTYASLKPDGCVLTKLDEAPLLGPALSVIVRHSLPLYYVTDGQRVPQDIDVASARRLVSQLAKGPVVQPSSEIQMAERFGRVA